MRTIFLVALFAFVAVAYAAPAPNPLGEDAEKLRKEAQGLIEKLKAEGKHVFAEEISVLEKEVELLEKKLKEINPTTELGKIAQDAAKKVLAALETKLKAEIKKLEGHFFDTKQDLKNDAAKLRAEVKKEAEKLKKEGKHVLAEEITVLEKEVEVLEKKIATYNPKTEVGKVALDAAKSILKSLETKLKAKIASLEKGGFFFDDTKKALGEDAEKLKKEAASVIEQLKKEGKHVLAEEISVIEKEVEALEAKIAKANPTSEVGKIALHAAESILKGLENKLKAEIKKLGGH